MEKRYPHIETDRLAGGVAVELEKLRNDALENNKDFAFETNYSSDMASEMVLVFKEAGYRINLVYFGTDNDSYSKDRVEQRALEGGHDVPLEIIEYNYREGIKRVKNDFKLYDTILFAGTEQYKASLIAFINIESEIKIIENENIEWFNEHFKKSFDNLKLSKEKKR